MVPSDDSDLPDDENTLASCRWVRIMCDYSAEGVWNKDGEECLVEDLPVAPDLRQRILDWQDWYDRDCADFHWPYDKLDRVAFSAEGLAIAQAVKQALPDWTVVYFDELKQRMRKPDDARSFFEYEIMLPEVRR